MKMLRSLALKGSAATAAVLGSATAAFAAVGPDVSGATTAIENGTGAVTAIGVACLTVLGGAVVFKLIRRAM